MSSHFEWETEEELLWQGQGKGGKRLRRPSKRLFLAACVILAIVAAGITLILRQIEHQTEEISADVAEEILASQQVWQIAISSKDAELFTSVLSGSQPNWMDAQVGLFDNELLLNRWSFGLDSVDEAEVTDIIVSPDLTEAEVILLQPYSTTAALSPEAEPGVAILAEGDQHRIALEHVLIFRRGQNQWLHSASKQSFWGNWKTAQSRYLTLSYPQRDAELAERLLSDLEQYLATMCATLPEINCAPDLHLHVRLDSDPRNLLDTADPAIMLKPATTQSLVLPAPSLIGLPVNEASYQALQEGYAAHILPAAIAASVNYPCCENGLSYQALIDKQLSQLGLRPWLHHLSAHYAQHPAPLPPLDQDIQLLCQNDSGENAMLIRYDPAEDGWMTEISGRPFVYMDPLPDDSAILIQERQDKPDQSSVLLWRDGVEMDVFGRSVMGELFRTFPGGQNLVLFRYETSYDWPLYRLMTTNLCDSSDCVIRSLYSPPIWSPDGLRTIVRTGEQILWLADTTGRNQTYLGAGITPFWLDENTVGYVQTRGREPDASTFLVLTTVDGSQTDNLIPVTGEGLAPLLPQAMKNRMLDNRAIKTSPAHPNLLLVATAIIDQEQWWIDDGALIFSYGLPERRLRLLLHLPYNLRRNDEFSFSPDGEWLTVRSTDRSNMMAQLHLHHLATDQTIVLNTTYPTAYPGYDWSADSQWVVLAEEGYLHLYAPAFGYQRLVIYEYPHCNFAAWINK